jgi:hypothetical protein
MKKISWLVLLCFSVAQANYDARPFSTAKGGTGSTSQSNNVVVTTNGSGNIVSTSSTTATEVGYVHGVTSAIQTQLNGLLPLSGGTMTGAINLGGFAPTNSTTPVNPNDLVNKSYVDGAINGISWHTAVLVATTANITLSGEQTIDGVTTSGSRVLVKNQTSAAQNGIYVSGSGAWTRATDMNAWSEVPAAAVFVQSGTANADLGFVSTAITGGTLGTTSIPFVQFSSAGAYTADNITLQLISGVFSVKNNGIGVSQLGSGAATSTQPLFANGTGGASYRSIAAGDLPGSITSNTSGSAASLSSTLIVGQGGTGQTSLTAHGVLVGEGSSAVNVTAAGTTGQVLTATTGSDPTWQTPTPGFSNPMTTLGDMMYENATPAAARVAGNTTTTKQFLTQTGTGTVSAAPSWGVLASGDIPNNAANTSGSAASLSATLIVGQGGTGVSSTTAYGIIAGGTTTTGAFQNAGTGSSGQVYVSGGSAALGTWEAVSQAPATVANGGNGSYSITAANFHIRSGTALTANQTYTLPACTASNIGERHEIKNLASQTFNIIVAANGSDTIDGSATMTVNPGDSLPVICAVFSTNGTWDIE